MCSVACLSILAFNSTLCMPLGKLGTLVFKNSSKLWHKYLLSFQSKSIQSVKLDTCHIYFLCKSFGIATVFMKFALLNQTSNINSDHHRVTRASGHLSHRYGNRHVIDSLLAKTQCKVSRALRILPLFTACKLQVKDTFAWVFSQDKLLGLHLMFDQIHFSPSLCYDARVVIISPTERVLCCGQQSRFSIYSDHHKIEVATQVFVCIFFEVELKYETMDTKIMHTYIFSEKPQIVSGVSLTRAKAFVLTVYGFIVKRIQKAVLKVLADLDHVVYNGPDVHSEQLSPEGGEYRLSTFQGVVAVLHPVRKLVKFATQIVSFPAKCDREIKLNVPGTSTQFSHHSDIKTTNMFLLKLVSPIGHQLNVSVSHFYFHGIEKAACLYGGMGVGEILSGTSYRERKPICQSTKDQHHFKNTFISGNNSCFIFIYWYRHTSFASTMLDVSLTKCRSVVISPCSYRLNCILPHGSFESCKSYLDQVSKHMWRRVRLYSMSRPDFNTGYQEDFLEFKIISDFFENKTRSKTCVVLQLEGNDSLVSQYFRPPNSTFITFVRFFPVCKIQLVSAFAHFEGAAEYTYIVTGSLSYLQTHNVKQHVESFCHKGDLVEFKQKVHYLIPDTSLVHSNNSCNITRTKQLVDPKSCPRDVQFFAYTSLKAHSKSTRRFVMLLQHLLHESNWVNIQVQKDYAGHHSR